MSFNKHNVWKNNLRRVNQDDSDPINRLIPISVIPLRFTHCSSILNVGFVFELTTFNKTARTSTTYDLYWIKLWWTNFHVKLIIHLSANFIQVILFPILASKLLAAEWIMMTSLTWSRRCFSQDRGSSLNVFSAGRT